MKPIFTFRFLWVTGFLLQAFSLMVSFKPLNDFLAAYLPNESFRLFFTIAALLFIEAGVFAFLDMALNELNDFTEQVAIRGFAVLFVGLSAFLTYHGSARIAVQNLTPLALEEKPADLLRVEQQLKTDRKRLEQIGTFQQTRNNNWLTPGEVAELASLQKRIEQNDQLLREQFTRLQTTNDTIKQQNETREQEQATVHHNFGFLTQLFLVMVFLARHVLQEKYQPRFKTNPEAEPERKHPSETIRETSRKPTGNALNISISDNIQSKVAQLTLEGFTVSEIAERLQIGKGTVSKARYLVAQQMVKDKVATIPEVSEQLNIDPNKLTEKLNGHAH